MTDSKKAALRQLQDENFRLRVELNHQRKCIDVGVAALRRMVPDVVASKMTDAQNFDAACRLVDDAIAALKEPVPK